MIVQSATGQLFRVDPQTGVATSIDLGGAVLSNGDGPLFKGQYLHVVQNQLNQIADPDDRVRGGPGGQALTARA